MNTAPIVSPSQVQDFEFCQQFWAFQREGWMPRIATRKLVAAIFSVAGHAGLAAYHRRLLKGVPFETAVSLSSSEAAAEYYAELDHYIQYGVNFGTLDVVEAQADLTKLLQKYHKECRLTRSGWKVLDVEHTFPEWGNARADIIVQDPDGCIVPLDFKIKREIKSKWFDLQGWLDEFAYTSKQVHYMLALEAERAQPVTRHYIYGITLSPWDHLLSKYVIPEYYKQWSLESLKRQWQSIEHAQGNVLTINPTHRSQYGECEMLKACTLYDRDAAKMVLDYVKVPRRKEITTDA